MDHPPQAPTVLLLCVHNAGRSQMAAGWLRHLAGDQVNVLSAGSEPAELLNPVAVEAMREVGIDISKARPTAWSESMIGSADVVVTMGCGDTCPVVPGRTYLDWALDDPEGKTIETVRVVRDVIRAKVGGLLEELGVRPVTSSSDGTLPDAQRWP